MTDQSNLYCESCGAKLASGANFCETCGKPVQRLQGLAPAPAAPEEVSPEPLPPMPPEPAQVYAPPPASTPTPAYNPPASAYNPPPKKSSKLPFILGGVGCLGLVCIGLIVAGVIMFSRNAAQIQEIVESAPLQLTQPAVQPQAPPTRAVMPTEALPPTVEPQTPQAEQPTAIPQPPQQVVAEPVVWPPDVDQQLTSGYLSDNFSSNQYDWADVNDEIRKWGFEDGHYVLHMYEPDYSVWAYLPVDFGPTGIGFDAAIQPGYEQGAYGVLCFYEDEINYHFISVDPWNQEYSIGYVKDDEYVALMENMWMPTDALREPVYAVNTVMVTCDVDMITLFINETYVAQAPLPEMKTPGTTAILGESWEDMPEAGFKVLFDNLYAYKPVQ